MGVTLDQILALTGRLDDESRFDAPRERFRRFLNDYVKDVHLARALVEQAQHFPSDQHQRAVHDLVVLCGRFLGFRPSAAGHFGRWESPSHFQVLVDVRSDQPAADDDPLLSAAAHVGSAMPAGQRPAALCVVTPLCMHRNRIDAAFAAATSRFPAGVLALRSLLRLAESVTAGRMSHDDLVRLIQSSVSLDFIVELVDRVSAPVPEGSEESGAPPPLAARDPAYWMCSVAADYDMKPEEFLELVVAKRLIFGIASEAPTADVVREGDGLCFYIAGKGIVGHARIGPPADLGRGLRDAHRFRQVLQLEDLRLYLAHPIPADSETQLRLRTSRLAPNRRTQGLIEISRESFQALAVRAIAASA